jgi:hypothetical protein
MAPQRAIPERGGTPLSSSIDDLRSQLEQLVEELAEERSDFETSPVNGRIYPADSIDYRDGSGLVQGGSSPSYWGGLWSLTCCKHKMRQEHFFDYFEEVEPGVLRPTQPLFVFTCAGKMDSDTPDWAAERRRWLTSVALVTHAFRGMDDYGRFLLEQDEAAWKSRITTQNSSEETAWARKKVDCHAIVEDSEVVGVDSPYPEHDHVSSSGTTSCGCSTSVNPEHDHVYHEDNDTSILKFASRPDYWMSWSEPQFYWTVSNGPDAWGGGQGKRAYRDPGESQDGTILSELRSVL